MCQRRESKFLIYLVSRLGFEPGALALKAHGLQRQTGRCRRTAARAESRSSFRKLARSRIRRLQPPDGQL